MRPPFYQSCQPKFNAPPTTAPTIAFRLLDCTKTAIYSATVSTGLECAAQFASAFAVELSLGSNFVSLPGRRFSARRKDVSFDFSVGKVNLVRITGFFTAISRFLTIGKFQFPGDFLVEEADIKKGCSLFASFDVQHGRVALSLHAGNGSHAPFHRTAVDGFGHRAADACFGGAIGNFAG
jgi:hypothetical protein